MNIQTCQMDAVFFWSVFIQNGDGSLGLLLPNVVKQSTKGKRMNRIYMDRAAEGTPFYTTQFVLQVEAVLEKVNKRKSIEKVFKVEPEEMEIRIEYGPNRTHLLGSGDIVLDASQSSDSSFLPEEKAMQNYYFDWNCDPGNIKKSGPGLTILRLNEKKVSSFSAIVCSLTVTRVGTTFYPSTVTVSQTIQLKRPPPPILQLSCAKNCDDNSDSFKPTVLSYRCLADCPKNSEFDYSHKPPEAISNRGKYELTQDSVVYSGEYFLPGTTVTGMLRLGFDGYTEFTWEYRHPRPTLQLKCTKGCEFDPRGEIQIQLVCSGIDCEHNKYKWLGYMGYLGVREDQGELLTIPAKTLKEDDRVKLEVQAWDTSTKLSFTLKELRPLLSVECSIKDEPADALESCETFDPRDNLQILIRCLDRCIYIEFSWELIPPPSEDYPKKQFRIENFLRSPENDLLNIPSGTYDDMDNVTVKIYTSKTMTSTSVQFRISRPALEIICISNCPVSDPFMDVVLEVKCSNSCRHLDYKWNVTGFEDGEINEKMLSKEKVRLVIPKKSREDGEHEVVGVMSGVTGAKPYNVSFIDAPINLTCVCVTNCNNSNPVLETRLKVLCDPETDLKCMDPEYIWHVFGEIGNFSWATMATFFEKNSSISIKPYAFFDGAAPTFSVNNRKSHSELVVNFEEPLAELVVTCLKNCGPSFTKLQANLAVKCVQNCQGVNYAWNINGSGDANFIGSSTILGDQNRTMAVKKDTVKEGDKLTVWVASRKSKSNEVILDYSKPVQKFHIECSPLPCEALHSPFKDVTVRMVCDGFCYVEPGWHWKFSPEPLNRIRTQAKSESLTALAGSYKDGDAVTVTLSDLPSGGGGTEANTTLNYKYPVPRLVLECVSNCWDGNPLDTTIVQVVCKSNCDSINRYNWTLNPWPADKANNLTEGPVQYEQSKAIFVIKPNTYKDNETVEVKVEWMGTNATANLTFLENEPDIELFCLDNCPIANPIHGVHLGVKCIRWCYKFAEYTWTLNPQTGVVIGPDKDRFEIKKYQFKNGDSAMVSVSMRKATEYLQIFFQAPMAKLELVCVKNCRDNVVDPTKSFTYKVICHEACDDIAYDWLLNPYPMLPEWEKHIAYGDANVTITVDRDMYLEGASTLMKVMANTSDIEQVIQFRQPKPELECVCGREKRTCTGENPFEKVFVSPKCTKNCEDLVYAFELDPRLKDIDIRNVTWKETLNVENSTNTIIISPYTFRPSESARVKFRSGVGLADCIIWFVHPPPKFHLETTEPCPICDPFDKSEVKVVCDSACTDVQFNWSIKPQPKPDFVADNMEFSPDRQTLTIKEKSYPNNTAIVVVATGKVATQTNLSVDAFLELKYFEPVPLIEVECSDNGFNNPVRYHPCHYHPNKQTHIKAVCKLNCRELAYNWTFTEKSPVLNLTQLSDTVTIPSGAYNDGDVVLVQVAIRGVNASKSITFLFDPWAGNCVIEPSRGVAAVTDFYYECFEFTKNATFTLVQNGVVLDAREKRYGGGFWLAENNQNETKNVSILVDDGHVIVRQIDIEIVVMPITDGDPSVTPTNQSWIEKNKIRERLFGGRKYNLKEYKYLVRSAEFAKAVQLANSLNTAASKQDFVFYQHIKKHLLDGMVIANADLSFYSDPDQTLSLLDRVAKDLSYHSPPASELLLKGCLMAVGYVNRQLPAAFISNSFHTAAQILSDALGKLSKLRGSLESGEIGADYEIADSLVPKVTSLRQVLRLNTFTIFQTIAMIGKIATDDENSTFCLKKPNVKICARTLFVNSSMNNVKLSIEDGGSYIIIDSIVARMTRIVSVKKMRYTLSAYAFNPFWWVKSAQDINTEVLEFAVVNASELETGVDVYLKIRTLNLTRNDVTRQRINMTGSLTERTIFSFRVEPLTMVIVNFYMVDSPYLATMASCVPNDEDFATFGHPVVSEHAHNVAMISYGEDVFVGVQPYTPEATEEASTTTTECPPGQTVPTPTQKPIPTPSGKVSYSFEIYGRSCYYWSGSEISETKNCLPAKQQPDDFIHCLCDHLSHFGAREYKPAMYKEATMDLAKIKDSSPSYYVLLYILAIFAIFIALFFLAWKADIQLEKKTETYHLNDNVPGDAFGYLVVISTGLLTDAGTTADVSFQFVGASGRSLKHVIRGYSEFPLSKNSEHAFVFYTPRELGDLKWVKLWHNSKGRNPHWYCERIVVQEIRTRKVFTFIIERWFSLIYGEGTTYGRCHVSQQGEIKLTFLQKLRESVRHNQHLLSLVYGRPRLGASLETLMVGFVSVMTIVAGIAIYLAYFDDRTVSTLFVCSLVTGILAVSVSSIADFMFRASA